MLRTPVTRRHLTALATVALAGLLLPPPVAAAPSWLDRLTDQALSAGADAQLPPHLTVVLGLAADEQSTPVRQLVARVDHLVHTFNVSATDRRTVVIILADEQSHATTAYLVSKGGRLRKTVAYGPDQPTELLSAPQAQAGFARERRYWSERAPP